MKGNSLFRLVIVIILLVLLVIFVTQNLSTVDVYFFVYLGKPAVITVILVSLLIGYILGLLTYTLIFKGGKKVSAGGGKGAVSESDAGKKTGQMTKTGR